MREEALEFAKRFHGAQKRKYLETPYWLHCLEVAELVQAHYREGEYSQEDMYCASLLHDLVEDTDITLLNISLEFNDEVATLVEMVTDVSKSSDGNRQKRKRIDREHLSKASPEGKTIKLADLVSNSQSIMALDFKFAKIYMEEKKLLLEVLTEGSTELYRIAKEIIDNYERTRNFERSGILNS